MDFEGEGHNSLGEQLILDHYKKVAHSNGLGARATMDDQYVREAEIKFIFLEIDQYMSEFGGEDISILDVGCGNAYVLAQIRDKYPQTKLYGIEFTPELYDLAVSREINAEIIFGDGRDLECFPKLDFDLIITERVIINILDRYGQYRAVENISSKLKLNGKYIMIESFREPLVELNHARKEMCLKEITESYQNKYLYERFIFKCEKFGLKEVSGELPANYLSTHFYVTRVFHKSVRPEGGKVKFSRLAKFFVEGLPPAIGNYAPILFRVFRRVK